MSTGTILEQWEYSNTRARAQYRKQLEQAAVGHWETERKEQIKMTLLLGENEFANGMQKLLKGDLREPYAVRQSAKRALSWEAITAAVNEVWDGDWQKISTRHGSSAKAAALHLARNHSDQSLRELGALVGGMHVAISSEPVEWHAHFYAARTIAPLRVAVRPAALRHSIVQLARGE